MKSLRLQLEQKIARPEILCSTVPLTYFEAERLFFGRHFYARESRLLSRILSRELYGIKLIILLNLQNIFGFLTPTRDSWNSCQLQFLFRFVLLLVAAT